MIWDVHRNKDFMDFALYYVLRLSGLLATIKESKTLIGKEVGQTIFATEPEKGLDSLQLLPFKVTNLTS